jgi:hypothetical protein
MKKKIDLTLIDKEIKKMLILNEYSYHHSSLTEEDDEDVEPEPEIEDVDIPDDTENDLEVTDEPTIEDVPNSDEFNDLPQEIGGGDVEEVDITDLKNDIDIIKQNIQNNDKFTDSITQALDKLNYIENKLGERFNFPYPSVSGAKAMTVHIENGGNPYDEMGKHITGICEEIKQLRKFNNS